MVYPTPATIFMERSVYVFAFVTGHEILVPGGTVVENSAQSRRLRADRSVQPYVPHAVHGHLHSALENNSDLLDSIDVEYSAGAAWMIRSSKITRWQRSAQVSGHTQAPFDTMHSDTVTQRMLRFLGTEKDSLDGCFSGSKRVAVLLSPIHQSKVDGEAPGAASLTQPSTMREYTPTAQQLSEKTAATRLFTPHPFSCQLSCNHPLVPLESLILSVSLITTKVTLSISGIHQLAFIMSTQRWLFQPALALAAAIAFAFPIEQTGNDFTFRFEWLKGRRGGVD
ncbi:hypothetical protein FI667_g14603, partial [Globisporangium splendens]